MLVELVAVIVLEKYFQKRRLYINFDLVKKVSDKPDININILHVILSSLNGYIDVKNNIICGKFFDFLANLTKKTIQLFTRHLILLCNNLVTSGLLLVT